MADEIPEAPPPPVTGPLAEGDPETYKKVFNQETKFVDDLVKEHGRENAVTLLIERMTTLRELSFVTKIRMNCMYMRLDQLKNEVDPETKAKIKEADRRYQPVKRSTEEGGTPRSTRPRAAPQSMEEKAVATLMKRLGVSEDQAKAMLANVPTPKKKEE